MIMTVLKWNKRPQAAPTVGSSHATSITLFFFSLVPRLSVDHLSQQRPLHPKLDHHMLGTVVPEGCCHQLQPRQNQLVQSLPALPCRACNCPHAGQSLQTPLGRRDAGPLPARILCARQCSNGLVEMELFYIPAQSADIYQGNKRLQPDHKTG